MWLDNLKELKRRSNMTAKQIADKAKLPERTVTRIFSGETDHPRVDTLHLIVTAMGSTLNEIFADTNFVVATESLVQTKEAAIVFQVERDLLLKEIEELRAKCAAYETKISLLEERIAHKDELLAVYKLFCKDKT